MNSLSRQALNYLSLSENGEIQARNKLCCLILLFEKDYQSKIHQLDEVLLLHILNHLTECYLKSVACLDQKKYTSTEQLVKSLTLSDLKVGDTKTTAFNRCTYYARELLGELKNIKLDDSVSELLEAPNEETSETTSDRLSSINDFTETEHNKIPAPGMLNIKIESREPIHKGGKFSSVYTLWNQRYNPAFK